MTICSFRNDIAFMILMLIKPFVFVINCFFKFKESFILLVTFIIKSDSLWELFKTVYNLVFLRAYESREIQGKLVKHDLTMKMFNFKISKLMQCFDKITDVKITKNVHS